MTFTSVLFNEGGWFNKSSGYFHAPVAGVYLFTASLCSKSNDDTNIDFSIATTSHSSIAFSYIANKNVRTCLSATAVTSLRKAERVHISVSNGMDDINFGTGNRFAGVLLQRYGSF